MREYMRRVCEARALDRAEERELLRRVTAGARAQAALEHARHVDPGVRRRLEPVARDGEEAKGSLVESYLVMVVALVRRYTDPGTEFVAAVRAGNAALAEAAETFDEGGALSFSGYARTRVRVALATCGQRGR